MGLVQLYHRLNTELADPRTRDWTLVSSPVPVALVTLAYFYFVLRYGPRYMEKRQAYKLFAFIRIYNVAQIIVNAWMVYKLIDAGWYRDYFFTCSAPCINYKLCLVGWYTLLVKLSDYIETPVFVLRKKQRQISFLHLYHHVTTVLLAWIYVKYFPNEATTTPLVLNCSVHVIMYTYYLLATFGGPMQRLLKPIKPMITIMQMVQFVLIILVSVRAVFLPECTGAKIYSGILLVDILVNFVLFWNFYKKNYLKKNKKLG